MDGCFICDISKSITSFKIIIKWILNPQHLQYNIVVVKGYCNGTFYRSQHNITCTIQIGQTTMSLHCHILKSIKITYYTTTTQQVSFFIFSLITNIDGHFVIWIVQCCQFWRAWRSMIFSFAPDLVEDCTEPLAVCTVLSLWCFDWLLHVVVAQAFGTTASLHHLP